MNDAQSLNILVVDDESVVRDFLNRLFKALSLRFTLAEDAQKALELASAQRFDLVFLDLRMPKMNGLELYNELKKIYPNFFCVFMTGYASAEQSLFENAKRDGAVCLKKPFEDISQIKEAIDKAVWYIKTRGKSG